MINLDMKQFIRDIKNGELEDSKYFDGEVHGYNLTNYIFNKQPDTRLWHYVNQDVGIFCDNNFDYNYIEDYSNGVPNWVYATINKMLEVARRVNSK